MWTLGINGPPVGWHDTAACLVDHDGRVIAFGEEERFCRRKHAVNVSPALAARYCLKEAGIEFEDVDVIAFGWNLPPVFPRYGRKWTSDSQRDLLVEWLEWNPSDRLPEIHFVEHHLAHAACGFYSSPFDRAAIVVVDGNGEEESISVYTASYQTGISNIRKWPRSHSLGYLYDATSRALGMSFLEAGKTMGLAAYGCESDALPWEFLDFSAERLFDPPFRLPAAADYDEIINAWLKLFGALGRFPVSTARGFLAQDPNAVRLAWSAQRSVERALSEVVTWARHETGIDEVCLAGGVALNCSANGKIREPVFVPPVPHDAGVALGAAWCASPPKGPFGALSPYYGPRLSLDNLSPHSGREMGASVDAVVDRLLNGQMGGIVTGRAEIGPRALSHRSILALPNTLEAGVELNRRKGREPWRPLSPVALPSANGILWDGKEFLHRYMLGASTVTPEARSGIPAVVHVDGTARVQCLLDREEPVAQYLIAMEAIQVPPALINTSFNARGEPIVNSAAEALLAAERIGLDFVVLEELLIDFRP